VSLTQEIIYCRNNIYIYEFIDLFSGATKMGAWSDEDENDVAKMEVTCLAKHFLTGSTELHDENLTCQNDIKMFKSPFEEYNVRLISLQTLITMKQKKDSHRFCR
jgi:hypothetical protein